jgi:hypothetical protein
MVKKTEISIIPDDIITSKIYHIRGKKVILDVDLGEFMKSKQGH